MSISFQITSQCYSEYFHLLVLSKNDDDGLDFKIDLDWDRLR